MENRNGKFKLYFDAFLKESIEENSFGMLQTHRNNLERLIGKRTKAATFGTGDIQKYVDKRSKEAGQDPSHNHPQRNHYPIDHLQVGRQQRTPRRCS